METDAEDGMVLLRTCAGLVEAKALQAMLEAEGIDAFIHGEQHRAQLGFLGAYVDLRLMVRASDIDDARELIEEADYAEHLPADDAPPAEDDLSVQRWREGSGDEPTEDEPQTLAATQPRLVFFPVVLALSLGLGTGHMYARRWSTGGVLALVQLLLLGLAIGGRPWAIALVVIVRVYDAIGGAIAVRRHNLHGVLPQR